MPNQYEIPAHGTKGQDLLRWLLEAVSEGEGWLSAQEPSRDWNAVQEMLGPHDPSTDLVGLSNTGFNLVERNARDIVASLSNFQHYGEFRPHWDKALYEQAHNLTILDKNWYTETHAHDAERANLQNAVCFGTGYIGCEWDKRFWGSHGDIKLTAYGPSQVTFVQLPADHDIQKAYAVIICEELPINLARRMYPNMAADLLPDRERQGWMARGFAALNKFIGGSPALRVSGLNRKPQVGSFPTVDIYKMYILDNAINMSPMPVKMGPRHANWSYMVPALGDPLPTGIVNPSTGQEWTRPAEEDDCRLFPLRRQVIFSRTAIEYDGTSPWWHGQAPVARVKLNDWAWQALGKSLLSDARTMQNGIIALMRYIEDSCAARLDPPIGVDELQMGEGFAKALTLRKAGVRIRYSMQMGDILKVLVPYQHYDVPVGIYEWIKAQEQRINHQMGTPDLVAIAKAKQVPGEGTLEKLMEMAGPLVQDMFRQIEVPQHQLGEWRKAYYFQFYTRSRLIRITGPDEEVQQDFEYSPNLIVPPVEGESLAAKQDRTRLYLDQFKYHLTESGVNETNRMINRLAMLQLKKSGVPIDRWTIAKAFKIPNYGPEPEGTHNVQERVRAEHVMEMEEAAEAQEMIGQVGGQHPPKGRPPSGTKPPQLVNKDHGTRQTIKQS